MKTESHSVLDILGKRETFFFIPPFQRAYSWGKPEVERFFNDVKRLLNSELDPNQAEKLEHFYGTLVLKEEKANSNNQLIIVDGQQRLTTTLLFLIALRDLESEQKNQEYITQTFLVCESFNFETKIKLKQVNRDWEAYQALVNQTEPISGAITSAYNLLKSSIKKEKNSNSEIHFKHFLRALQRMNLAVILLEEQAYKGEDPQIIFETLNSLGKPLTLSDLIRNFILLGLDSKTQKDVYETKWHPKIERVLQEYTSNFFRDYLQYKTSRYLKIVNQNNTKELYKEFKNFTDTHFEDHLKLVDDILRYVKFYKWIIIENDPEPISEDASIDQEIKELLRNIFHDIRTEAFKPFVLGLLEYHQTTVDGLRIDDELLLSSLETIRNFFIRRRVLGLNQGENNSIPSLYSRIKDIAQGSISVLQLLTDLPYSVRFPNDIEIRQHLKELKFGQELKTYSKFILGKMQEYYTKTRIDFRNYKVDFIMPPVLNEAWQNELGTDYKRIHETYLHNIGNLILVEPSDENPKEKTILSFREKKQELKNLNLFYKQEIIQREKWNEQSIKEHQENMTKWFLETFSLPEDYRNRQNYNTKTFIEDVSFSPLEEDAPEMAEGNKPFELSIFKKIERVSTWQDVFLHFVRYLYLNQKEYDFNSILENQTELFGSDRVILTWANLKKLLETNRDWMSQYKTFGGKTPDKVNQKELKEDLLFMHIYISARTCIERIASIMEKLYIPEDEVKITLK